MTDASAAATLEGVDPPVADDGGAVSSETKGVYMVLWAPISSGAGASEEEPAMYREIGYYRGQTDKATKDSGNAATAKRRAMADRRNPASIEARGAAEGGKILLRAVPAQSWPADVEPTGYERPAPRLRIR